MVLDLAEVDHKLLLEKLQLYGIHPKILKWIESFLIDRKQAVVVDGHLSFLALILSGVPQGHIGRLQKAIDHEADATSREQLLGLVEKEDNYPSAPRKQFPLVIKFNPRLPPMSKFINRHLNVLELTNQTKSLFNKSSLFVSYRMEKNILNMITSNKFKSDSPVVASPASSTRHNTDCPAL
ncbi:hypothetical protein ACHWQZ_G019491 [Mnemiopsis leidyi]